MIKEEIRVLGADGASFDFSSKDVLVVRALPEGNCKFLGCGRSPPKRNK